ncbi:3'(2'),5'-bisphosphate nucleotidase CysQ [Candidatus Saccharibacteria bacterium]|nr:3'(2'),5'-bisphosphate nucleotidase CysQ [Candidatus Saccharibacteria bacterium]MBI3338442.1 3'(2'),5'-bisphosphate nucleotidase CysQ [Candidatus Saccharibacteria bacterium]
MANVQEQLGELLDVFQEADKAVMDVYDNHSAIVEIKADNTPVTQVDIASHHIVTGGLLRLFPDIPVVSEEGDKDTNVQTVQGERFWLVDPLDGTKEFLARTGHFTICAALIESDRPSFGIISAPALGVTYYGGLEMGSYKKIQNQEAQHIRVSTQKLGVVLGSRSDLNEPTSTYIAEHFESSKIVQVGSQLKLPEIAEGLADAYPRIDGPLHLWDLAAGQAILEGAGGAVTKPDGSPINYHAETLKVGDFVAKSLA